MAELNERKAKLLKLIVEHYIQTAEPVSSAFVANRSQLGLSGATMRNEMRELEELGFLTHPHTSAGRMPTLAGYQYYLQQLMQPVEPSSNAKEILKKKFAEVYDSTRGVKLLAKYLATEASMSIIVSINHDAVYYTGISNLFRQPEFRSYAQTMNVSSMFDHIDERMDDMLSVLRSNEPTVFIGDTNPLGNACGCVAIPYKKNGFFAVIGPQRMPYAQTVGLLSYIHSIL